MNKKILLLALAMVIVANLFILYISKIGKIAYPELLLIPLLLSLGVWYIALRASVPIGLVAVKPKDFLILSPIFFVSIVVLLIVFLNDDYKQISEKIAPLLLSAFIISLYEEILFRGITLGSLISISMGKSISVYLSALIFSFSHVNFMQSIGVDTLFLLANTFMMGVFLGYIYLKSNNILIVIGIHTIWDLTVFINQLLPTNKFSSTLTLVLLLVTVLYFFWSIKRLRAGHLKEIN